jgi:predicted dehydrogenase
LPDINIAVVGAGYWGQKVIREYQALSKHDPNLNFTLICDANEERLQPYQNAIRAHDPIASQVSTNYTEVLAHENVNAIHLCTPNDTHYTMSQQALLANKHLLLEKPMALTHKHANDLVELAESQELILQVGHIFRFNNALQRIRELIANQYFGTVYYLKLQWTTLIPKPLHRDIIFDLAPHPIDILNYLLDQTPQYVYCKAKAYRTPTQEEMAYITMEFDEDVVAYTELSWLQPEKTRRLTIVGSEHCAFIDCLNQDVQLFQNSDRTKTQLPVQRNNTILDEITHFSQSIRANHNSTHNNGHVGIENVKILESLRQSLREDRVVKIT